MEPWSLNTLLLVFGGGIVGAAFGGLWSVIVCALLILVGSAIVLAGGSDFLLMQVAIGPIFGPHVGGFAVGLGCAAYAQGVAKNHPGGSAKDILSPLLDTSWDVMLVGGILAIFGHALLQVVVQVPILNKADALAVVVVASNALSRLLFLREWPWGNMESIKKHGYLNTDNCSISWVPWQAVPSRYIVFGLGMGIMSGALALGLKDALAPMAAKGTVSAAAAFVIPYITGWVFAIFSLTPLNLATGSIQKVPVAHNFAIWGALTAMHTGNLLLAGIAGIAAGFVQELMARMLYNHGSSHIDPPAAAIAIGSLLLNLILV